MSEKKTSGNLPGPGPGRPKGLQNKVTRELKGMVLQALDKAGGVKNLTEQAKKNPRAFLALLARVLPLQVQGDPNNPLQAKVTVELVAPSQNTDT